MIREPRGLLRGYGQGGPDLMIRPANSNRKIVIDVSAASSVQVGKIERQAKPLVKAKAAADRKWRQKHFGCRGVVISRPLPFRLPKG